jgi:hypothetical protein
VTTALANYVSLTPELQILIDANHTYISKTLIPVSTTQHLTDLDRCQT